MREIHFMCDLESRDTKHTAIILQIGIVAFNLQDRKIIDSFFTPMSTRLQVGRTESKETLEWWAKQPNRDEVFTASEQCNIPPISTLSLIELLISSSSSPDIKLNLWSKGAFDYDILGNMYESYNIAIPWKYYQIREFRSVLEYAKSLGFRTTQPDNNHNALEDALNQTRTLFDITDFFTGGINGQNSL